MNILWDKAIFSLTLEILSTDKTALDLPGLQQKYNSVRFNLFKIYRASITTSDLKFLVDGKLLKLIEIILHVDADLCK